VLSSRIGIILAGNGFSIISDSSPMTRDGAVGPCVHFRSTEGATLKRPPEGDKSHAEVRPSSRPWNQNMPL